MHASTIPRPDLALIDDGRPRVRALETLAILLSHAPNRDMVTPEGVDDLLSMVAWELHALGALMDRFQEHHEL